MSLTALQKRLGYTFRSPELLHQAFTHSSITGGGGGQSYERLEFLGDRVLGFVIARLLFDHFPTETEGDLAKRHAYLVSRDVLAEVGNTLGLGLLLQVDEVLKSQKSWRTVSLVADV